MTGLNILISLPFFSLFEDINVIPGSKDLIFFQPLLFCSNLLTVIVQKQLNERQHIRTLLCIQNIKENDLFWSRTFIIDSNINSCFYEAQFYLANVQVFPSPQPSHMYSIPFMWRFSVWQRHCRSVFILSLSSSLAAISVPFQS